MLKAITSIYRLVFPELRPEFFGIAAGALAIGLLEMLSVASIMPLIAAMIDPDGLSRNASIARLMRLAGFGSTLPPIHVIGTFTIGLFVVVNAASLLMSYWTARFSARTAMALSERFAMASFRHPFTYFLAHSPAELAQRTCSEAGTLASAGIWQLCNALVRVIQLALIVMALLVISPQITIAFFVIIATLYGIIYRFSAVRMAAAGKLSAEAAALAVHRANEMYAISREVLLTGRSRYFIGRIKEHLHWQYLAETRSRVLPSIPKYALEVLAVGLIFALPIYRSMNGEDARAELPLIATFAYAGFRLLPVAQQPYSCLTLLHYYAPLAARFHAVIEAPAIMQQPVGEPLESMPEQLALDHIGYHYANAGTAALIDATFSVSRGERVAIVGPSGAGKSTLVDLLLGLLRPTSGAFIASGRHHPTDALDWSRGAIGYVPQQPLLLADTLAANIAFGEEKTAIDLARCRQVALTAGIGHILEQHPNGLGAVIGRDIQDLSGGERQRLAIARGLYAQPSLLVLDEPASALDPPTARRMFEQLCAKEIDATVIIITHNVEHLSLFDKIVFVDGGRVAAVGTPAEVMRASPAFAAFTTGHLRRPSETPR